jgi:AcrR family transcriptional regulator
MPATPAYQRARRPEHKHERREAILLAARELAGERAVREVSLGDIARRVGLAKSNVLRYFETREEVYLRLLLREWEAWQVDVAVTLWSRPPTPAGIAATLARSLAERPLLCDLLNQMAEALERNVSAQMARAFKSTTISMVSDLGAIITELLPGMDPEDGRETISAAIVIVAGLWPMANPSPRVQAMLAETPELIHGRVDFEHRLEHMLAALIAGFLPLEDI